MLSLEEMRVVLGRGGVGVGGLQYHKRESAREEQKTGVQIGPVLVRGGKKGGEKK